MKRFIALVSLVFLFLSCNNPGDEIFITQEIPVISPSKNDTALITGVLGDVLLFRSGESIEADIGQSLVAGDNLKVGSGSSVDLQIGETAMARILENSSVSFDSLVSNTDSFNANANLSAGTILSKLNTLVGNNTYQVSGTVYIAGARGTEFGVSIDDEGNQTLGVRQGRVAVLPRKWTLELVPIFENLTNTTILGTVLPVLTEGQQIQLKNGFFPLEGPSDVFLNETKKEKPDPIALSRELTLIQTSLSTSNVETLSENMEKMLKDLGSQGFLPPDSQEFLPLKVKVTPADAQLAVQIGERIVTHLGEISLLLKKGETVTISASKDGFHDAVKSFDLTQNHGLSVQVNLLPTDPQQDSDEINSSGSTDEVSMENENAAEIGIPLTLNVKVQPYGEILINGTVSGTNVASVELLKGSKVALVLRGRGLKTEMKEFVLNEDTATQVITLAPQPLIGAFSVGGPAVGSVLPLGDGFLYIDTSGSLFKVDMNGTVIWRRETKNSPNENSIPQVNRNRIIFSGSRERLILNANNGAVITRTDLESSTAHPFGQKTVAIPGGYVSPTMSGVDILDEQGSLQKTIPVEGISVGTPSIIDSERVLVMGQSGEMNILSSTTLEILKKIQTGSSQATALAPLIVGNSAFVVGRRGQASGVNLETGVVEWEYDLGPEGASSVTTDLEPGCAGFYVYSRGKIIGLAYTGNLIFNTAGNTPPLFYNNRLYFGKGTQLVVFDTLSSRTISTIETGEQLSTRPAVNGTTLVVGTSSGKMLFFAMETLN